MFYFQMDTNAFKDERLVSLRLDHTGAAVDAYYAIIDRNYESEMPVVFAKHQAETKAMCHTLCVGYDTLATWVATMVEIGLLEVCETTDPETICVYSPRAMEAISAYHAKSEKAREAGRKGGLSKAQSESQATAKQTLSEPQANVNVNVNVNDKVKERDKDRAEQVQRVVSHLNVKTGKAFKASSGKTKSLINARLNEGFTVDDLLTVVDVKAAQWLTDPKMSSYLRPETLFGTKCEAYLNEKPAKEVRDAEFDRYASLV